MDPKTSVIPVTPKALTTKYSGVNLLSMGTYVGTAGTYEIFGVYDEKAKTTNPLLQTKTYKVYVARFPSGQVGLMKINTPGNVEVLKIEAEILKTLQLIATQLDEEFASRSEVTPNYGAFFPTVVETLTPDEGKFVMLLGYHPSITNYQQLIPLSVAIKGCRVDLQTVQWILGKSLKVLDFVHSLGYSVGLIDPSNILLETSAHGVFFLDFTQANETPSEEDCLFEVTRIAEICWWAAGGTSAQKPPYDNGIMTKEGYEKYIAFIARLCTGETTGARAEYEAIYPLADEVWPKVTITDGKVSKTKRPFHPWVTYK